MNTHVKANPKGDMYGLGGSTAQRITKALPIETMPIKILIDIGTILNKHEHSDFALIHNNIMLVGRL